jgi:monofunctional biosynthetic peptidoglycan transglycosylase
MWRFIKKLFFTLLILQFVYILLCKWVNPPLTITQFSNWVGGHGLKRDYIPLEDMGGNIRLAVIAAEDQLFPQHNGFDMKSIKAARKHNEKHPNRRRGASTISQQTAKNVFLWQGGGYFRKGVEVYFTFMIETVWSKRRILEVYLNVIEMGEGVFGIEAASQHYFHKPAKQLTRKEAALIAACLPNPKKYKPLPTSKYVEKRAQFLLKQMRNLEGDPEVQKLLKD